MGWKSAWKGWFGEFQTTLGKKLFLNSKIYLDLNNVTLETANGTTQIDHVIVSRYGLFVVETKNMSGWIFGNERDASWTQSFHSKKFKFQNPLRQNLRHTKSLAEFLGIEHAKIHSVIFFWGTCEFKTEMPPNVMTHGYISYIKEKTDVLFAEDEVAAMYDALKTGRMPRNRQTKKVHLASLETRHGSTTVCPKCGGGLVVQTAKRGKNAGNQFLGCANYPRCRFTREVAEVAPPA